MAGDDLFGAAGLEEGTPRPLADRLRPQAIGEVVGQDHLIGQGAPLRQILDSGRLPSLIFWGPPGTGKTTLARLLADHIDLDFIQISAIFSGVGELRKVFDTARARRQAGRGTLLFVDEIHRFNRTQQDSFLPVMEDGTITLVGATTENPSFALNAALLSRAQVLTLKRLDDDALGLIMARAEAELGQTLPLTSGARSALIDLADGDGRFLIGLVEDLAARAGDSELDEAGLAEAVQRRMPVYDKAQEGHYNLASALQKSIRGSDTDAALYWTARMLNAGEDPLFILRRLTVMASEDIGNADPQALVLAHAAREAYQFLGDPEGHHAIGQLVTYLGSAPKSNAAYSALKQAKSAARQTGSLMPPKHAMNAPTKLMKDEGYSDGYVYDHDTPEGFAGLNYFPPEMARQEFYTPRGRGAEKTIRERLEWYAARRKKTDHD
ncbi:MAG: replication-associated recombination protein A [Pseudomonadota bacterium]